MVDRAKGAGLQLASERVGLSITERDLERSVGGDGIVTACFVPCRCGDYLVVPLATVQRVRKRYRHGLLPSVSVCGCPACTPGVVDFSPSER